MKRFDVALYLLFGFYICAGLGFGKLVLYDNVWKSYEFEHTHKRVCEDKPVVAVGACDKGGNCRVVFKDGTGAVVGYPMVGQPSSVCHWEAP